MNENINLCKILKGLEGIELYTDYFNCKCIFLGIDKQLNNIIVEIPDHGGPFYLSFDKHGEMLTYSKKAYYLYPSEMEQDWGKFEIPIKVNTPMMCLLKDGTWVLKYYAGIINGQHKVYRRDNTIADGFQNGMIPFDKFNPNNIEESLKYNIQK